MFLRSEEFQLEGTGTCISTFIFIIGCYRSGNGQVREQLGNVILGVGFFGLLLGKHLILRGTDPLKLIFDPENLQVGLQCTHTS